MHSDSFSILTPTWNRRKYLERVFDGLKCQTFKNFEWIIADDGSVDGTFDTVHEFAKTADFPIVYIRSDIRVGKAKMDNLAVQCARGEFVLWCDSDDYLLPNALEELLQAWQSIPVIDREKFVGITALAGLSGKAIENPFPNNTYMDVSWNELSEVYGAVCDMLFCVRSDIIKKTSFPEVDYVVPESVVWSAIGHAPTRLISKILKNVEYTADNRISYVPKMEYNRGRAYSLAATVYNLKNFPAPHIKKLLRLVNYVRYSIHGDISFFSAAKIWGKNINWFLFLALYPLGLMLSCKDIMEGKVVKTHKEFEIAKCQAKISMVRLNN